MQKTFCRVPTFTRLSRYQVSLLETRAMRPQCAAVYLPLFDHLVSLAASSHASFEHETFHGRSYLARRAGRELAQARKLAQRAVCAVCGYVLRDGTGQCAAFLDSGQHNVVPAPETAIACPCLEPGLPCDFFNACAALKG